jgi:hypothetical protein
LIAQIGIADELKRLGFGGHAHFDETANFVHPAGCHHGAHARIDFRVEPFTRRREADFRYAIAFEPASAAAMDFADRFSGKQADFDRANDFLSVTRCDSAGGFAIQASKQLVQMLGTAGLYFCAKTFAEFFRPGWRVGESLEQSAKIKAGACGEDGKLAAPTDIFQRTERAPAIFAGGKYFLRLEHVDEMVRNSTLLDGRHFRGPDIEVAVDLGGVAEQNFAVETPGKFDTQRGLSGSGGPEDYQEPREVVHPENFQYRSKRISKTTASNNKAPATCARFSLNEGPLVPV